MKRSYNNPRFAFWLCLVAALSVPLGSAQAYVGPGIGAGAIAVVLGLLGSVFLAIFAFVWYPLKRLLKLKKRKAASASDNQPVQE